MSLPVTTGSSDSLFFLSLPCFLPPPPPHPHTRLLPNSRSIRKLSLWPPSGPSPPSTPSATPCIPTARPRSSPPPCHAPSRPCRGSSARSTINETPGPSHLTPTQPLTSHPPPTPRPRHGRLSFGMCGGGRTPPLAPAPPPGTVEFGIRGQRTVELVDIDY